MIQISCSPTGRVNYNGETIVVNTTGSLTVAAGTAVTLVAEPNSGDVFLYWVNQESERIFSFEPSYTFQAVTYMKLQAVFYTPSADWHYVTYLTSSNNVVSAGEREVGVSEAHTDYVPFRDGYTWTGNWSYSVEAIALSTENLLVYPTFTLSETTHTVTTYANGSPLSTQSYGHAQEATVSAPTTLGGETFSYWAVIDEENFVYDIVSYYSTYKFFVVADTVLTAVYGEQVTSGIVVRIAGDNPEFDSNCVTVYSERSISPEYTVVQHGILFTTNAQIARSTTDFVINPLNNEIKKMTSSSTMNAGTYAVTKTNWSQQVTQNGTTTTVYPVLYFRPYVILRDSGGNVLDPIYGDFYVVEYADGTMPRDDIEDPFA